MKLLRTVSTRRLLAAIAAIVALSCGGAAIAVAATSGGPVPAPSTLPNALHALLSAPTPSGVTAGVTFTDNLLSSANISGISSPLLTGASGRLWADRSDLRLELQSQSGDTELLVSGHSFWLSDPSSNTVYEGTIPQQGREREPLRRPERTPTVAQIQQRLQGLSKQLNIAGPQSTDIGGRPAYSVTLSPVSHAGLLGSVQLAWDAVYGLPLDAAVFARGDSTPMLQLQANSVSYGSVDPSVFQLRPPASAKVVHLALSGAGVGRKAHSGEHHALQRFGSGLSTIFVFKHPATGGAARRVIATELGTLIELTRGNVGYIVAGSVKPAAAEAIAHRL